MTAPTRPLVVLPTYQEADNIAEVLRRLRSAAPDVSVLVVDDASPDGTAALAEAAGREMGGVEVLRRPGKAGLGSAYRAGFAWGFERGHDAMVEMDADLSHDPAALPSLLRPLGAGVDLVIGSRYVPGGSIPDWSLHRRLLSQWGNRYAGAMLDLDVRDVTSGYRAYRADALTKIDMSRVRADGYGFQIEMAYRLVRCGLVVEEVPIAFTDRTRGTSKMSTRIVAEAMALVTWWGVRDRLDRVRNRGGWGTGRS
ncbi:polyprenol monophosphomannose synthase [soil metagenome]